MDFRGKAKPSINILQKDTDASQARKITLAICSKCFSMFSRFFNIPFSNNIIYCGKLCLKGANVLTVRQRMVVLYTSFVYKTQRTNEIQNKSK